MISHLCLALFVSSTFAENSNRPTQEISFQSLNFILFVIGLVWLLKKPLSKFFKARKQNFLAFESQARKEESENKKILESWKAKIQELDFKSKTIKETATKEGQIFLNKKNQELQAFKEQLEAEKNFVAQLEFAKIKKEFLKSQQTELVKRATKHLKKESLSKEDQENLYNNFFKQIESCK